MKHLKQFESFYDSDISGLYYVPKQYDDFLQIIKDRLVNLIDIYKINLSGGVVRFSPRLQIKKPGYETYKKDKQTDQFKMKFDESEKDDLISMVKNLESINVKIADMILVNPSLSNYTWKIESSEESIDDFIKEIGSKDFYLIHIFFKF